MQPATPAFQAPSFICPPVEPSKFVVDGIATPTFVRVPARSHAFGLSATTRRRRVRDELLLPPIGSGDRLQGYYQHEIDTLNAALAARLTTDETRHLVRRLAAIRTELASRVFTAIGEAL